MNLAATLSDSSLSALESALRAYASRVEDAAGETAMELGKVAADKARELVPTGRSSGNHLKDSIAVTRIAGGAEVTATSEHAAFVEFGTGREGSQSMPSSMLDLSAMAAGGYVVDGKMTGSKGWHFPAADGSVPLTHGQAGRGFMAAGAEEARQRVAEVARRAVKG